MKTVLLITNIPTPYRVPLFNELSEQLSKAGYQLHVIFAAKSYSRRNFVLTEDAFQFAFTYLDSGAVQLTADNEKTTFTYKGLITVIRKLKPEVVITNGFSPATMKLRMYAIVSGLRFLIWTGAIQATGRYDSVLRKLQRKWLASGAAGFIAYGTRAKAYIYEYLQIAKPVYIGINTVDTTFFESSTAAIRQQHISGTKFQLTFTGYLVKRKETDQLISVMAALSALRSDFTLNIIGSGPEMENLKTQCKTLGIESKVHFHGYLQKEQLPEWLAKTDLFLFQTGFDIWGLVLNEAMAAGLPVVASVNAGATADLIVSGITGYTADFSDTEGTASLLHQLLDNPDALKHTGASAAAYIREKATLKISAGGFVAAIAEATR